MAQANIHEQTAHVDQAAPYLAGISAEDRVVKGATTAEVQANLAAKRDELAAALQTIHDGCDHGVGIDAILRPDTGRCETEEEGESAIASEPEATQAIGN